jgi:hypothetical protein
LNIREISNIYIGPFLFSQEKDGPITNARNDISRKLFALLEEKGEGFERNMLKLLHEKNQGDVVHVNEEEMPVIKERFLEAYHETEKLVAKREEHKQEVIGLLQQLYESKKIVKDVLSFSSCPILKLSFLIIIFILINIIFCF